MSSQKIDEVSVVVAATDTHNIRDFKRRYQARYGALSRVGHPGSSR